ncbi:MAG: hypothetical protein ACRDZX_01815 [Acidimicrobiales bacterium]
MIPYEAQVKLSAQHLGMVTETAGPDRHSAPRNLEVKRPTRPVAFEVATYAKFNGPARRGHLIGYSARCAPTGTTLGSSGGRH